MIKSSEAKRNFKAPGHRDPLTGLYNQGYFKKQIRQLDTGPKLPLSVIICDINGVGLISDTLGYAKKDVLLINAAKYISACIRRGDVAARSGDERFLILLPQTSGAVARVIIERIESACQNRQIEAGGELLRPNMSMGYATKERQQEDIDGVLNAAEQNMFMQKLAQQKSYYASLLQPIKKTLYEKSHETEQHGERLICQSRLLGEALGLSEEQLASLELLAMLHDIGKVGIDANILTKPGPLDEREWNEIKKHPDMGYRIARAVPQLAVIAQEILSHHERWDGSGYPNGLRHESIPLLSRIIAVVDAFDALTTKRCYREAVPLSEALCEIERNMGTQFDPRIASVFVGLKRAGR